MVLAKCDVRFLGMHSASFFFLCVRFVRFHLSQSPFTREWGYGSGQVCGLLRCAELSTIIKFPRKRFDKATRQTIHSHPSPHPPPPQEKRKWIRRERERIAILMLGCKRGANQHHPPTTISLSRGLWYLLALIDVFGHVVETHPIEIRCLFAIRCSSVCLLYVKWYT